MKFSYEYEHSFIHLLNNFKKLNDTSKPSSVQRNITDPRRVRRDLIQNKEPLTFIINWSIMKSLLIVFICFCQQPSTKNMETVN